MSIVCAKLLVDDGSSNTATIGHTRCNSGRLNTPKDCSEVTFTFQIGTHRFVLIRKWYRAHWRSLTKSNISSWPLFAVRIYRVLWIRILFLNHLSSNTYIANIITLSHGCILGWLSPYLPLLKSAESPLETGPVTLVEASWIGAIICVGGVTGNFTFALLTKYLGCKRAISCLAFPQVVSIYIIVDSILLEWWNACKTDRAGFLDLHYIRHTSLPSVRRANIRRNDGWRNIHMHSAVCGRDCWRPVSSILTLFG